MLEVAVTSTHGTSGSGRFFPHTGFFGLSPLVLSGTITTRLPALCQPLPVRQILVSVKCYETRTVPGSGGDVEAVVWEKTRRVWEANDEYEGMGDWDGGFKLSVPPEVARVAPSVQCTRDSRVVWRLEVALDHKPIQYVGSRIVRSQPLDVRSYLAPAVSAPLTPPAPIGVPGAQVYVHAPSGAYGPGDTFTVSFHVRPEHDAVVRKGSVVLERQSHVLGKVMEEPRSFFSRSRSRSASPGPSYRRLDDEATTTSTVLETSASEPVETNGTYWLSATGTIPRRAHKWDAGETGRTSLLATSFGVRAKFTLKTKGHAAKEITCPSVPVVLVATSAVERSEAASQVATLQRTRRHRSSRRGMYMQEGTTDIADPVFNDHFVVEAAPVPGVKPILRREQLAGTQSIQFAPAEAPGRKRGTRTYSTTSSSASDEPMPMSITQLVHPLPDDAKRRHFHATGRRISATTSEEEEAQPSRSRPRLTLVPATPERPSLPSLGSLGLGLPNVPEYDRTPRPRTAPHTVYPSLAPDALRPATASSIWDRQPSPSFVAPDKSTSVIVPVRDDGGFRVGAGPFRRRSSAISDDRFAFG